MVEFGLKLEDNKVSEWGDLYIQYEKLKQILKKCEADNKRVNELANRDSELATSLRRLLKAGQLSASTPMSSSENLLKSGSNNNSPLRETEESTSEKSILLETRRPNKPQQNYGSQSSGLDRSESGDSVGGVTRALLSAAGEVTTYFGYSLERQMKDALLLLDKHSSEFEMLIIQDIGGVNAFYNEKLGELEDRLNFLKETVANNIGSKRKESIGEEEGAEGQQVEDDDIATPLIPTHRRTKSPMEFARTLVRLSRTNITAATDRFSIQHIGLEEYTDEDAPSTNQQGSGTGEETAKRIREAESIQRALVDQYRTAKLLHNYAIMNYTGFVKIVKKHDKLLPEDKGKFKEAIRPSQICDEGRAVEDYTNRLEKYYAAWFCGGNRSEARAQLLPKKGDTLEMDFGQLRLGYRLGMCTILGMWVCWDCIWGVVAEGSSTIGERTAFPVFRACGGLLALQWFWGMSTWVWSRYRINYIYLFDFNPRIVDSPLKIFNTAVDNTLFFLTSMLLYYKAGVHDIPGDSIPAGLFPFLLVVYTFAQLVLPLRTRGPMWVSIWKLVTAPVTSPSFYHGYVGDIFTSMVKVFQDLAWTLFFVFNGDWLISEDSPAAHVHTWSKSFMYKHVLIPLLTLLPLWFRFNQCLRRYADTGDRFPHLANAFKYALSQTVTLFGAFHPLYMDLNSHRESNVFQLFWLFAFIGSSLYSFVWDVYMDWGLGRPKYNFLGPRLMYPKKGAYYAIIGLDLVLRFAWVLTLIPPDTGAKFALPRYLTVVSMILELYRRTVWGFLRLENEHRSNTQGYRRVGFVPLHFSTGHMHEYKQEQKHRGFSVLLEVSIITMIVVGLSFGSVIAARRATERLNDDL